MRRNKYIDIYQCVAPRSLITSHSYLYTPQWGHEVRRFILWMYAEKDRYFTPGIIRALLDMHMQTQRGKNGYLPSIRDIKRVIKDMEKVGEVHKFLYPKVKV